ncbi:MULTISPECIES: hypothetical protein [Streptococcus]|jgi:hypothetical protein|uniref:Uncharacterized protein n=3 Tax=Streptococcus oralis TaxID=1303 RepID=A0A1X1GDF7_STROR|nr:MULTISPECIES: hypothetical protein [Streptococcus]RKV90928.1 MAG: hypothetical protein D8H99_32535 [Streptococcus sp.]MBS9401622.1 hypothetical protein [Streptococcus oralis]MCY7087565.1 hypothetical protein [Streptococcus oralis]ORO44796.1 hypothetical protein B7727_01545 [Streptococcus oralis subsp. tigurinus]ORO57356.1 hypothetical protein B7721_00745 [Streptococcus oralis subsp. oralis]
MIPELLKSVESKYTIETDGLTIKNNAIITRNNSIQISNLSMLSKSEFKSPVTLRDIFILIILFMIGLIPPFLGLILFGLYAWYVYNKHQNHLKSKYYIVFNLGSSQNYLLYFEDAKFRDTVFNIITESFGNKAENIYIDIKNQNIENYDSKNIYEKEVSQTTVSGNDNVVGNDFGSGNNVTLNGDNNVNSNIVTDSILEKSNMNVEFPWSELSKQLQQIVNNASVLSEQSIEILKDLLAATEKNSESEFTVIVKENASFFNQQFIKDIISGTLGGVISSLLSGR